MSRNMAKVKNYYIKYKLAELEEYIKDPESCVKKINHIERLTFAPNIVGSFKDSIMRILSRKIGKYDIHLQGVVLDFRNTKVLNMQSDIRNDSAYSVIKADSNFYIFSPRKGAIVDGIVKHINNQSRETIISVVIYRVFNVKVVFKGCIRKNQVNEEDVIKIRIQQFHFENEIPYIEGEMIGNNSTTPINTRRVFDDVLDSGISEGSTSFEQNGISQNIKIERDSDSSPEPTTSSRVTLKQTSSKRKRDKSPEDEQPILKKIKHEKLSSDDDDSRVQSTTSNHSKKSSKNDDSVLLNSQISSEKKKKDKKKKKKRNIEDEFESSLQLLFDTSNIKTEKN